MLINLRNALMAGKRLPYDAEVEYLESTGTQWIDTGVFVTNLDTVEIVASGTGTRRSLFGSRTSATDSFCIVQLGSAGLTDVYFSTGSNYATYHVEASAGTAKLKITMSASLREIFNLDTQTSMARSTETMTQAFTTPDSCYLFGASGNPWATNKWVGKVYRLTITRNSVPILDLIPVRKGTTGYLYDRVTGKLFGNAGTGDFVLGQDVVPVEYLQSDGGQYIQTNFTPDDSYGFEVDCFTPVASSSYNSRAIGLQNGQVRWLYCTERRALSSSFFGWNEAVSVGSQPDKRIVARCNWLNNRTISIGDTVYKSNLATLDSVGGLKAVLFGINNGGSVLTSQLFVGKMYSAKVSVGNAIGYNYAPVRVGTDATSWDGAMMDVLTRRIYRNAGSGAFGYGNDLPYPIPA